MKKEWPGKERRYPSWDNPCKYTLDRIKEEIVEFSQKIPRNSRLLDFGCGEKPYYPFFKERVKEYIGVDIEETPEKNSKINITIKQGDKLPFPNEHFDVVISTQVFEHIEDLSLYAKELRRVLKNNGLMLISAAFAWDYHPYPKDYWRISEDGYRILFNNFSEINIIHDTNSVQTILQSFNLLMARKKVSWKFPYEAVNFLISLINYRNGDKNLPANIFVYLRK